jgi:site-specific DNA recombinase
MNVAAYLRNSTDDQALKGTIANQRNKIEAYAKARELDIIAWYEDAGISGKILISSRPQGKLLIEDAKSKLFNAIIVTDISRLGRTALDILKSFDLFKSLSIPIISIDQGFDGTTAAGEMSLTMFAAIAQYERHQILDRSQAGINRSMKSGKWIGRIPFGYRLDADRHLEIDPDNAKIVRTIYENIANGSSLVKEADRYGWKPNRLSYMLNNTLYYGVFTSYNRQREGRKCIKGDTSYTVPAIVSKAVWLKAQVQLKENLGLRQTDNPNSRVNVLRGLLKCHTCGHLYVCTPTGSKDKTRYYYRCNTKPKCKSAVVHADTYEHAVWELTKKILTEPNVVKSILETRVKDSELSADDLKTQADLKAELNLLDRSKQEFMGLATKGLLSFEDLEKQLEKISKQRLSLSERLEEIEVKSNVYSAKKIQSEDIQKAIENAQIYLSDIENTARNTLSNAELKQYQEKAHELIKNVIGVMAVQTLKTLQTLDSQIRHKRVGSKKFIIKDRFGDIILGKGVKQEDIADIVTAKTSIFWLENPLKPLQNRIDDNTISEAKEPASRLCNVYPIERPWVGGSPS